MNWEAKTEDKFKVLISKIPVFHRRITESVVVQQAQNNALLRKSGQVEEQDVIAAFFQTCRHLFIV